ncbi:hypothetical protein [Streptomyces sp. NPDC002547]
MYADRAGRLWRIAEMCARCAAATPGCRALDTAPPPAHTSPAETGQAAGKPAAKQDPAGGTVVDGVVAVFSDHGPSPDASASSSPDTAPASASRPRGRAASPGGATGQVKRWGKIAQRIVPPDLEPDVLRLELIELGDAFRAYQRAEPDLALLADLHERKARAFALWADISGDRSLRQEAERAEKAAQTTRETYANHGSRPTDATAGQDTADGGGPVMERLLTRQQAAHARTVLDYVQARTPHPDAEVRLAVLMLTLRAARAGTGNIVGQDLNGWLQDDAEQVLERLVDSGWMRLPDTIAEVMASRPEDPVAFTVPTLLPEQPRPFTFGKTTRARISGWAQKIVGDRKLRKKKATAATRLLALYTTAHTQPDGRLGHPHDDGLPLDQTAAFCALPPEQVAEHAERLIAADWLTEGNTTDDRLRGQLTERTLPLGALL